MWNSEAMLPPSACIAAPSITIIARRKIVLVVLVVGDKVRHKGATCFGFFSNSINEVEQQDLRNQN